MDLSSAPVIKEGFNRCAVHALRVVAPGFGCSGSALLACVCKNRQFWEVALPFFEKSCSIEDAEQAARVQQDVCATLTGHKLSGSAAVALAFPNGDHLAGVPSYAMISIGFAIGIVVLFAFGTIAYRLGCCGNRHKHVNDDYIPLSSTAHDGAEVELPGFDDEEDGQPPASASGFILARVHKSLLGHPLVIHPQSSGTIQGNFPSAEERLDEMKKDGPLATTGQPGNASSSAQEDLEEGLEPPPPYEAERE